MRVPQCCRVRHNRSPRRQPTRRGSVGCRRASSRPRRVAPTVTAAGRGVEDAQPGRVLVVCTGNVCRSPLVQVLLQHELDRVRPAGSPGVVVGSAGTGALVGSGMDARAAAAARSRGVDPSGFVARELTRDMVAAADLVLTATRAHRRAATTLYPRALGYAFTYRDFADLATHPTLTLSGSDDLVPQSGDRLRQTVAAVARDRGRRPPLTPDEADLVDPYRQGDAVYELMVEAVESALPAVANALT